MLRFISLMVGVGGAEMNFEPDSDECFFLSSLFVPC